MKHSDFNAIFESGWVLILYQNQVVNFHADFREEPDPNYYFVDHIFTSYVKEYNGKLSMSDIINCFCEAREIFDNAVIKKK